MLFLIDYYCFQAINDDESIRFSDDSVNERMHLAEMFRLTSYEEHLNIFHSLNPSEYDEARALIISLVLVTDIKVGEIKIWDFFLY
mgnify:FL=1